MFVEGSGNNVERVQSRLLNLVVPSSHRKPCSVFNRILGEDHPQRMAQAVSGLNIRIIVKENGLSLFCVGDHLSADLKSR